MSEAIDIEVNGTPRQVAVDTTVADLLEQLSLPVDGLAVAIGRDIVPRSERSERRLAAGDRVEILRAVGGG